jgi:Curli production assembly/transport component CsgG
MRRFWGLMFLVAGGLLVMQAFVNAQAGDKDKGKDKEPDKAPEVIYPAALFTFEERGAAVRELGPKVTDILFAKLAARAEINLVDRSDLKKILGELELNISGVVKPAEANKIGQMTGAKIRLFRC